MASNAGFCRKCGSALSVGAAFCPSCGTPVAEVSSTTAQAPISGVDVVIKDATAQTYWVKRVVAFVVDAVIVFVAVAILVALAAIPLLIFSAPGALGAILGGVFGFLAGVILFLYFTVAEALTGGSIGKRVLGLKVVAAGGRPPSAGEALIRNVSKIYWILLVLDIIVGLAVSKGYTQKYTDKLMGTSVVNV